MVRLVGGDTESVDLIILNFINAVMYNAAELIELSTP